MVNFLLLMVVPILIALGSVYFWKGKVTLGELGAQIAVPAVCMAIGLSIAYYQSTWDREIWNGRVDRKWMERVSCRHSYPCNCRQQCSGSGKNQTCYTVCDTCYEHSYDQDWNVSATTGEALSIDTIDRQGLKMPPRWGAAFIGEPWSSSHSYTNYILANPDSVLLGGKGDVEKFKPLLPTYPEVYDYYRTSHAINVGGHVPMSDLQVWEWLMDEINGDLGPKKQVNLTLLFVKTTDPRYMLALKDHWIGGKKNDAVIVIGAPDGLHIAFADVLSWTPNAKFKVLLRDEITKIGLLSERDKIATAIRSITETHFTRMQMKDYEYLVRSFQPSSTAMLWLFILGTLGSLGLAWFCITNEFTDESNRYYRRYY